MFRLSRLLMAVFMLLIFSSMPVLFAASSACATAPCCKGSAEPTFNSPDGCCQVSMCAQTLPQLSLTKATTTEKIGSGELPATAPLLVVVMPAERQPLASSPPLPTRERLALLSTLLI